MTADGEQVVRNPRQLGEKHPQVLGARRYFQVEQLFDREHETVFLAHRRNIIEPVEIGQRLEIGLVFDQLLGAAMKQADMRIDALDDLAVELHHQAQYAMGRGMLRSEVDRVIVNRIVARRLSDLCFLGHCRSPAEAALSATTDKQAEKFELPGQLVESPVHSISKTGTPACPERIKYAGSHTARDIRDSARWTRSRSRRADGS